MSNIETAKALLKKGIALGDQELINMANQLLGASQTLWYCEKCQNTFDYKGKKSCPLCKGRKISELKPKPMQADVSPPQEPEDFSIIGDESAPVRGTQISGKNFRPTKLAKELSSISDKELALDANAPEHVFKIKETNIRAASRPPAQQHEYNCNFCNRKILSWTKLVGTFHICNRCGNR